MKRSGDPVTDRLVLKLQHKTSELVQSTGERTPNEWNKRGFKKMEKTVVSGHHGNQEVTIYFHRTDAIFGASLHGTTSTSTDYRVLISALGDLARAHESVVFHRYIQVDYDRMRGAEHYSLHGRGWGGEGREGRPVVGIRLDFWVYDVSDPFPMRFEGGKKPGHARVWRLMERPAKPKRGDPAWVMKFEETMHVDLKDFSELIPFTESRYETLIAIQDGIRGIDERLALLFGARIKDQALALDRVAGQKALSAPMVGTVARRKR